MLKLYYSPGAVSLVTHMVLEETGLPYELERVAILEGQQHTPEYRRIHPLSRVPALELGAGDVLTETPAILQYLSDLAPAAGLMPVEMRGRARANEWMSLFASHVHVTLITFYRPQRYTDDAPAHTALQRDGKARFIELLGHIEARLPERGFLLGDRYGAVDAYAAVFVIWARRLRISMAAFPRYGALTDRVLARPAVRRALDQEGLESAYAPPVDAA
ncbi:MAG TPA: glutathione S-transferase family protein [Polyangiaceae bacterium]